MAMAVEDKKVGWLAGWLREPHLTPFSLFFRRHANVKWTLLEMVMSCVCVWIGEELEMVMKCRGRWQRWAPFLITAVDLIVSSNTTYPHVTHNSQHVYRMWTRQMWCCCCENKFRYGSPTEHSTQSWVGWISVNRFNHAPFASPKIRLGYQQRQMFGSFSPLATYNSQHYFMPGPPFAILHIQTADVLNSIRER